MEIESFIFAPANVCNSINDCLHCLVTSAPTSVQPTPPGQEPAIPGKIQFAEMFSFSESHGRSIVVIFRKYSINETCICIYWSLRKMVHENICMLTPRKCSWLRGSLQGWMLPDARVLDVKGIWFPSQWKQLYFSEHSRNHQIRSVLKVYVWKTKI